MTNVLTIEDISTVTRAQIDLLCANGIALIKISDDWLQRLIHIETVSKAFFHLPASVKNTVLFGEDREGFLDQSLKGYHIERYITRGTVAAEALQACRSDMLFMRQAFANHIVKPLLKQFFVKLELLHSEDDIVRDPDYTLSVIYYPPGDFEQDRLAEHRDSSLMTVLWTQTPGFEAYIDHQWQSLTPDLGYVVLQTGNVLQKITGGQCQANLHRVTLSSPEERLSMAAFFSPNDTYRFIDHTTGQVIAEHYGRYVTEEIKQFYKPK